MEPAESAVSAQPLQGVVLCCTSIPVDLRTDLAKKVAELGGIYKNDLTHEVTHLIVGDYNTPKYRHVACERPDIRPMCAGWIDAVLALWTQDAPIDTDALEEQWRLRTFEANGGLPAGPDGRPVARGRLLCSMTGFEEAERQEIISAIVGNGGVYSGDLTRDVTHLVVRRPEGKKYTAALHWGVQTVSVEWLHDCVTRGMILDESKYDPRLPSETRGHGAWVRSAPDRAAVLGKRQRDAEAAAAASAAERQGVRKLRRTASKKLSAQRDHLWGDILGKSGTTPDQSREQTPERTAKTQDKTQDKTQERTQSPKPTAPTQERTQKHAPSPPPPPATLAASLFCIHGFSPARTQVLVNAVATMGGTVVASVAAMAALVATRPADAAPVYRHVIVPQETPPASLPAVPDGVVLVTEFFVEKCLHKKHYVPPSDTVIGRPFPVFPIPGFAALAVCTSGFSGVDLNQVDKAVRQIGARYEERFTAQCSVLVVTALAAVRKQKLELALAWKVPVVDARWLWACIAAGVRLPLEAHLFPQLRQSGTLPQEADPVATIPTLVMPSRSTLPPAPLALPAPPSRQDSRAPLDRVVSEIADSDADATDDHRSPVRSRPSRQPGPPMPTMGISFDDLVRGARTATTTAGRYRNSLSRAASAVSAAPGPAAAADEEADPAPTQVQVQVLDPDAEMYREQLMRKVLGVSAAEADSGSKPASGVSGDGEVAAAAAGRPVRRKSSRLRQ